MAKLNGKKKKEKRLKKSFMKQTDNFKKLSYQEQGTITMRKPLIML